MATNGVSLIPKSLILHPNLATPQPYDGREYGVNSRIVERVVAGGVDAAGYSNNAGQALLNGGAAMMGGAVVHPLFRSVAAATVDTLLCDVSVSDGAATAVRVVGRSGGMQVGAAVGCGALAGAAVTCMHPALAGVVAVANPVGAAVFTGAVVTVAVGSLLWFLCKDRRAYAREMAYVTNVLRCSANETPEAFINVVRSQWLSYHPDNHPNATEEALRRCHELQRCNKRYAQLRGWDRTASVGWAKVIQTVEDSRLKANAEECRRRLFAANKEGTFLSNAVLSADGRDVATTDKRTKDRAFIGVHFSDTTGSLECVTAGGGVDIGLLVRIAVVLPRCDGDAIYDAANPTMGAQPVGWIGISYFVEPQDLCIVTFASDAMQFLIGFCPESLASSSPQASAAATASV